MLSFLSIRDAVTVVSSCRTLGGAVDSITLRRKITNDVKFPILKSMISRWHSNNPTSAAPPLTTLKRMHNQLSKASNATAKPPPLSFGDLEFSVRVVQSDSRCVRERELLEGERCEATS